MTFRLKKGAGNHADDDKLYKAGDIIKSEKDLDKMFQNKFERIYSNEQLIDPAVVLTPDIPKSPITDADKDDGGVVKEPPPDSDSAPVDNDLGNDVTEAFPTATTLKLKVFENAHWYSVVDMVDNQVLNTKKLRKKEVAPFLLQYSTAGDVKEE